MPCFAQLRRSASAAADGVPEQAAAGRCSRGMPLGRQAAAAAPPAANRQPPPAQSSPTPASQRRRGTLPHPSPRSLRRPHLSAPRRPSRAIHAAGATVNVGVDPSKVVVTKLKLDKDRKGLLERKRAVSCCDLLHNAGHAAA